jgi:hypothetical protein
MGMRSYKRKASSRRYRQRAKTRRSRLSRSRSRSRRLSRSRVRRSRSRVRRSRSRVRRSRSKKPTRARTKRRSRRILRGGADPADPAGPEPEPELEAEKYLMDLFIGIGKGTFGPPNLTRYSCILDVTYGVLTIGNMGSINIIDTTWRFSKNDRKLVDATVASVAAQYCMVSDDFKMGETLTKITIGFPDIPDFTSARDILHSLWDRSQDESLTGEYVTYILLAQEAFRVWDSAGLVPKLTALLAEVVEARRHKENVHSGATGNRPHPRYDTRQPADPTHLSYQEAEFGFAPDSNEAILLRQHANDFVRDTVVVLALMDKQIESMPSYFTGYLGNFTGTIQEQCESLRDETAKNNYESMEDLLHQLSLSFPLMAIGWADAAVARKAEQAMVADVPPEVPPVAETAASPPQLVTGAEVEPDRVAEAANKGRSVGRVAGRGGCSATVVGLAGMRDPRPYDMPGGDDTTRGSRDLA